MIAQLKNIYFMSEIRSDQRFLDDYKNLQIRSYT